jgi:hypothetical protein
LQKDLKLPRAVVRVALDAWRAMVFHDDAVGVATYEALDDDMRDLQAPPASDV